MNVYQVLMIFNDILFYRSNIVTEDLSKLFVKKHATYSPQ